MEQKCALMNWKAANSMNEPAESNNVVSFLWAIADLLNRTFQKSKFSKITLLFAVSNLEMDSLPAEAGFPSKSSADCKLNPDSLVWNFQTTAAEGMRPYETFFKN